MNWYNGYDDYSPEGIHSISVIDTPAPAKKRGAAKRIAGMGLALIVTGGVFFGGYIAGTSYTNKYVLAAAENRIAELSAEVAGSAAAYASSGISRLAVGQEFNSTTELFAGVESCVVSINTMMQQTTYFNQTYNYKSAGSGVVFKEDDSKIYIVTNYHVINGAVKATVSFDDATQVDANYVGGDENNDIAVISVEKAKLRNAGITGYKLAAFADSSKVRVGDTAIAIGNAMGEGKSATQGIISALDRAITIDGSNYNVFQTDAAINPGNSGGALLNSRGQVIGINSAKLSQTGVEGMGYAIPSNIVVTLIDKIVNSTRIETPYLGVETVDVTEALRKAYNFPSTGIYINSVQAGSPAAAAGLRQGDIIVQINGKDVRTGEALSAVIGGSKVGDTLAITIYRGGNKATVNAVLKNKGLGF